MAFVSNRVCTSRRSIPFIFTIKLERLLGGSRSTSAFVILLQGKTMSLSELKHLFLIKRVSYLINFPLSNTRGMESYWFLYFLHVSTTGKIIEKLARINEVSSLAGQPIPWKCEVFLWEQAFNFVPAEDRGTEQIGLRLGMGGLGVWGGGGWVVGGCVYVWRGKTRYFSNNKTATPLPSIFPAQRRLRKQRLKHLKANNDKLPPPAYCCARIERQ